MTCQVSLTPVRLPDITLYGSCCTMAAGAGAKCQNESRLENGTQDTKKDTCNVCSYSKLKAVHRWASRDHLQLVQNHSPADDLAFLALQPQC
jgi:hypothetical protein